jgi:hypothetical protein
MFRMDAPSPGNDSHPYADHGAVEAQVYQGENAPAVAATSQANPGSRRRHRDDELTFIRRMARSVMHDPETTLPAPDPTAQRGPHEGDRSLFDRARAGLEATETPQSTVYNKVDALIAFSAWLNQAGVDKKSMHDRLFTAELTSDVMKYVALPGADGHAQAALRDLRAAESSGSGTVEAPRRAPRRSEHKAVPQDDRDFINEAFDVTKPQEKHYKRTAESFSEWLAKTRPRRPSFRSHDRPRPELRELETPVRQGREKCPETVADIPTHEDDGYQEAPQSSRNPGSGPASHRPIPVIEQRRPGEGGNGHDRDENQG